MAGTRSNLLSRRFFGIALGLGALTTLIAQGQSVSPEYFNHLEWRLLGPFRAGRAVAVGGEGGSSPVFYFGSVDGGVWKTQDAGMVWRPKFDGQPVASIGAIEVAPSDAKTIYVGTGETDIRSDLASGDGVYRSIDGGETWQNRGLKDTRQISRVVVDPRNAKTVYAGALGYAYGNNEDRGVYKSTDGGAAWKKVLYLNDATGVADLALVPEHPDTLFACMWDAHRPPWSQYPPVLGTNSGLYRSTDGGKTWQHLTGHGLPEGKWGRSGVAVSADGRRVYALIEALKAGVYVSDDGGETWRLGSGDARLTGRDWYFSRITIDPKDENTFYVPNTALYRSRDAGKTLEVVRGAPGGDDYHELWIDPKNPDRMVLGTDHGVTISIDHGLTWTSWYNQPTAQLYHVIVDDQFPYVVYGAQQDDGSLGIFSRTDHESINARDWFIAGQSESGYIALDPKHPEVRYITSSYGGVVKVDDRKHLSKDISPWPAPSFGGDISQKKYRATWTPVLVMSPVDKALYLGTQYVMKTVDGGMHWARISPDLTGAKDEVRSKNSSGAEDAGSVATRGSVSAAEPSDPPTVANSVARGYGTVFTIAPSPKLANVIWSGSDTGVIYVTRNGGTSWSNVTPPGVGEWSKISLIEASRWNPATAYAAVDRHRLDDREPYIYRTRDYGKTWTRITLGLSSPDFVYAVREDAKQKGLLFAGTEFGVFVSFDDGDHWQSLQLNLPVSSARDLAIHGDDLIVATHGRSFWVMDDIAPLRQISEARTADGPFFFQPATAIRADHDPFPSTRVPVDEPVAKNPPDGALLDYYLPEQAQKVELAVYDVKNRLVRHWSSDKPETAPGNPAVAEQSWRYHLAPLGTGVGMHRFLWGLTWEGTGAMDNDLPDAGSGLRLLFVAPGRYRAVLKVDGRSLTRWVTVLPDPRAHAGQVALDQQQELGLRIYEDYLRAGKAIEEIRAKSGVRSGAGRRGATEASATPKSPEAIVMQHILQGDPAAGDSKMGLLQVQASLESDLSAVRSGYDAPTAQERKLYEEVHAALESNLTDWQKIASR